MDGNVIRHGCMEDPRLRTPAPLSPGLTICVRYSLQTGSRTWGQVRRDWSSRNGARRPLYLAKKISFKN